MSRVHDIAIAILRHSDDGDILDLPDLCLVEAVVNGCLTPKGARYLQDLQSRLEAGQYRRHWLHGIPNLTANPQGLVFWRGIEVECYRNPYDDTYAESLLELSRRCRHVESLGLEPTGCRVVNFWQFLEGLTRDNPYFGLFARGFKDFLVRGLDEWMLVFQEGEHDIEVTGQGALFSVREVQWDIGDVDTPWHKRRKAGFISPAAVCGLSATTAGVTTVLHSRQVPTDIHLTVDDFCRLRRCA